MHILWFCTYLPSSRDVVFMSISHDPTLTDVTLTRTLVMLPSGIITWKTEIIDHMGVTWYIKCCHMSHMFMNISQDPTLTDVTLTHTLVMLPSGIITWKQKQ